MPCEAQKALNLSESKFDPLSVMILCGTPYLNVNSLMKLIAVQASRFLMGLASIHLVNLSTATSTCVKPLLPVLNGPTMSSPQTAKGQTSGMVFRADAGLCDILE